MTYSFDCAVCGCRCMTEVQEPGTYGIPASEFFEWMKGLGPLYCSRECAEKGKEDAARGTG